MRNIIPRQTIVGYVPDSVAKGGPDARDEVRAYANRIFQAWESFWLKDVEKFMAAYGLGKGEQPSILIAFRSHREDFHDVLFGASDEDGKSGTLLPGLSIDPGAVKKSWETLEDWERQLRVDRKLYEQKFGKLTSTMAPLPEGLGGGGASQEVPKDTAIVADKKDEGNPLYYALAVVGVVGAVYVVGK
jgi:hypothetical protein